jgi:hypothetical protein
MPVDPTKTHLLNEGRVVGSNICNYGGFPRILKETYQDPKAATLRFNDANDISPSDEKIATRPDQLWSEILVHGGYAYPSRELMGMAQKRDELAKLHRMGDRNASAALSNLTLEMSKHPHFAEFQKGHPSKRNRPTQRVNFAPNAQTGHGAPGSGSRYTGD